MTPDNNELLLERAIAAMRDAPELGDFPADQMLLRVAAPSGSAPGRPLGIVWRIRNMKSTSKLAASVLLALGLAAATYLFVRTNAAVAFADVVKRLHDAHSLSGELTVQVPGQPPMTTKLAYLVPGRFRMDAGVKGITVLNSERHRMLALNPGQKIAIVFEIKPGPAGTTTSPAASVDWIEKLKQIGKDAGKAVGAGQIDGRPARQFKADEQGQQFTIWADARTGTPLQVETETKVGDAVGKVILSHLVLDAPLDESQFTTDVPAGYAVQKSQVSGEKASEQDLVRFFREYADRSGGVLPPTLRDLRKAMESLPKGTTKPTADARLLDMVIQSVRAMTFLGQLPPSADWHYAGAGVKLGTDRPVFWYRPTGSDTYRVIYGDLRTADVAADQLPRDSNVHAETSGSAG